MSGYAVVWRNDEELPHAGRLELTEKALSLHGRDRPLVIPYAEILGLERGSQTRIGRARAIMIFTKRRNAGELLVATVGGVGLLSEIFTALQQALGG